MHYQKWSKMYTFGFFLGSAVGAAILLILWFLGFDTSISYFAKLFLFLIIVISFSIGVWYYELRKNKKK